MKKNKTLIVNNPVRFFKKKTVCPPPPPPPRKTGRREAAVAAPIVMKGTSFNPVAALLPNHVQPVWIYTISSYVGGCSEKKKKKGCQYSVLVAGDNSHSWSQHPLCR
jgi:hypothetical protein